MKTSLTRLLAQSLFLICLFSAAGHTHHSTSGLDYTKTLILEGVIKEFQWTNPHSYLQLVVTKEDGAREEWSIEVGTPMINYRMGWDKNSLQPGDEVTLNIAPARNGSTHGTLRILTFADGRPELSGVARSVRVDEDGNVLIGGPPAGSP